MYNFTMTYVLCVYNVYLYTMCSQKVILFTTFKTRFVIINYISSNQKI